MKDLLNMTVKAITVTGLLSTVVLCLFSAGGSNAATVPALSPYSLVSGATRQIPNGTPHFLAIGFSPNRQSQLEQGMALADTVEGAGNNLTILEVPVLDPQHRALKTPIETFMRQQVKSKRNLSRIYPLFWDPKKLKQALGIPNKSDLVFLLCNASGKILWLKTSVPVPADLQQWQTILK
jgi:hypothetical protein